MPLAPVIGAAFLTFGAPALAWGALACAVPVLIHLTLRQRPRRQILPSIRFLLQTHEAATRAHRLRQWLLMLCRVLVVLLMVSMLMKTRWSPGAGPAPAGWFGSSRAPVSAVICLDDSASMGYRFQGRSRFRAAGEWVSSLLADRGRFPAGSEAAVLTSSSNEPIAGWTQDLAGVRERIGTLGVASHGRGVSGLLRQAYALLPQARHPLREIYLLTDLTARSWRESPPDLTTELTALYVLDVGQEENLNVSLSYPQNTGRVMPAGVPAELALRIRAGDLPASPEVGLIVDGQPRSRQAVGPLGARSEAELALALPAMMKGTHEITVELDPQDALESDNRRFVCVSAGDLPEVAVVGSEGDAEVASIISAMIAPPALPAASRRFAGRALAGGQLTAADLGKPQAVILADPGPLSPEAWRRLAGYVHAGGAVLVIPGPNQRPDVVGPFASLLPMPIQSIVDCPEPIHVAVTGFSSPLLKPFEDSSIDSINDRAVFRRLALGPPIAGATTVARFTDGQPALVEARAGPGRVILLAFSPAAEWSQFGTQAGPMIVFLHATLEALSPQARGAETYRAGQFALIHPTGLHDQQVWIKGPPTGAVKPQEAPEGRIALPTDLPGHYQLLPYSERETPLLCYSVNVPDEESDASRAGLEGLLQALPPGRAVVVSRPDQLARMQQQARQGVDLTVPLALALLGTLLAESVFANRFYFASRRRLCYTSPPDDLKTAPARGAVS